MINRTILTTLAVIALSRTDHAHGQVAGQSQSRVKLQCIGQFGDAPRQRRVIVQLRQPSAGGNLHIVTDSAVAREVVAELSSRGRSSVCRGSLESVTFAVTAPPDRVDLRLKLGSDTPVLLTVVDASGRTLTTTLFRNGHHPDRLSWPRPASSPLNHR